MIPEIHIEITDQDCLRQLSGEVFNIVSQLYGEVTPAIVEHCLNELLYAVSFRLRQGQPVALEAIGQFIPARVCGRRIVAYHPVGGLFRPMSDRPVNIITLADRRRACA